LATAAQQLEQELINRPDRVMVVAGIGVSLATCGNHPCASWKGLLEDGLQRCEDVCGTGTATLNPYREILKNPAVPPHALIGVGQFITDELKGNRLGTFGGWLSDSIGGIKVTDPALPHALASLGARLATTNYDNMIEASTSRPSITWRDRASATTFFREITQDVLHLHGHYRQPDTVILGARSYDEICRDDFAQIALRGWMITGTLVFVGCGAGLEDPNFRVLLDWARTSLAECHHSHFILVRSAEVEPWRSQLNGIPVTPVPYGPEYSDLEPFLNSLAERVQRCRISEPLSLLSDSQADFDSSWDELDRNRGQFPIVDYFRRSRILAAQLWRAGGRRRAALSFSSRLTFQGQQLLVPEYVEFALDAAEWLVEEGLPSLASHHLMEIGQRLEGADPHVQHLGRFRSLRVRCMDALCAYTEALRAIKDALPHADHDERARLQAEWAEIHFLQGRFDEALADPE
jgi:hypothetical protein